MKKNKVLLRALLLSTSKRNTYKYSTDKKKKRNALGNLIGKVILYLLILGFGVLMCFGYGNYGIIDSVPVLCALMISALGFIFTLLKTNGYLFGFKEYDMIMSLPFEAKDVATCKFMYMYVTSLPWYLSISVAMLIGYGYFAKPSVAVYPVWLVLSLLLPLIPMVIAAFIGFIFAKISSGFRRKNIIQTVLVFILVIGAFAVRFIFEDILKNNKLQATLETISSATDDSAQIYLPAKWFSGAVTNLRISDMMLLSGISILLFAIVFYIVGRSYGRINSALRSHAAAKKGRLSFKRKSVVGTITYKEFKRMTGSTTYLTNIALGPLLAVILGLAVFFVGFDRIISMVTNNAPFDHTLLEPAIPLIAYFFIGMVASTTCSSSLEGKNYWIIQSLPIEKKKLYQGKMLFNIYLMLPAFEFSILCMCISAGVNVLDTILYMILGISLCAFSTAWGCVCGIKHIRLDWENEIEVIKQGTAVAVYLLPNMFVVMLLIAGVIFLGMIMNHALIALILILISSLLAWCSYIRVMAMARK